ncbi:MAG: hypothetical protein A2Z95_02190 [Gallionellales bacterium GWA2_60_18]|nr:MAG: hypothetical protein A2Z95_02190 [Gallionellales bacterium GWA2_60_18]
MQSLSELCALVSDGEVSMVLKEYFSEFGTVISADRFHAIEEAGQRCFLVKFENSTDAIMVANQQKLRPFAFDCVLVDL